MTTLSEYLLLDLVIITSTSMQVLVLDYNTDPTQYVVLLWSIDISNLVASFSSIPTPAIRNYNLARFAPGRGTYYMISNAPALNLNNSNTAFLTLQGTNGLLLSSDVSQFCFTAAVIVD